MKITKCGSCDAPIIWAITKNNKRMPVDAEPCDMGNVELINTGRASYLTAVVHGQRPIGAVDLHTSHFVTCPNASEHRK